MADFNTFCDGVKRTTKKVVNKTGELAETAAAKVTIKALELRMSGQYEKLGELVYKALREGADNEAARSAVLTELDALAAKIAAQREKTVKKEEEVREGEADDAANAEPTADATAASGEGATEPAGETE